MLRPTRVLRPPVPEEAPTLSGAQYACEAAPTSTQSPCAGDEVVAAAREVDFFAGKHSSYQYGTILRPPPCQATAAMNAIYGVPNVSESDKTPQLSCSALQTSPDPVWSRLRGNCRSAAGDAARQARRLQQLQDERLDASRAETIARHDLEQDALCRLDALYAWCGDVVEHAARQSSDRGMPLAALESRLSARQAAVSAAQQHVEALCRDEGRRAWQQEVAQQHTHGQQETVRAEASKREDDSFRAAMVFLVVEERKDRASLDESVDIAYARLVEHEAASRKEAARLACERFLNTPEQLAITAALQRRVATLRKRWAKHDAEQKALVNDCLHGAGGQSVFTGTHTRKICARCRVRLDDGLGFYVRMDRPLPLPLPSLQQAIDELEAPRFPPEWAVDGGASRLAATARKRGSSSEGRGARRSAGSKPSSASSRPSVAKATTRLPPLKPPPPTRAPKTAAVPSAATEASHVN